MLSRLRIAIVLFALLAGCSREEAPLPEVEPITSDDAELNAAMEQARDTFDEFVLLSHDPDTEGTAFLAKVRVTEGKRSEDLWVNGVKAEEEGYSGIVNEAPMDLKKVEALEEIRFTLNQVVDWQYFGDGKVVGAFIARVERSRMTDQERAEHDDLFPFPFD